MLRRLYPLQRWTRRGHDELTQYLVNHIMSQKAAMDEVRRRAMHMLMYGSELPYD